MTMTCGTAAAVIGLLLAAEALAQGRAEGSYPAVLVCDPSPATGGTLRDTFWIEIAGGKASFARKLNWGDAPDAAGGVETATGTASAGQLTLTSRGAGKSARLFEASYAGEVDGRGGLLTGVQRWTLKGKRFDRRCQVSIGGRG